MSECNCNCKNCERLVITKQGERGPIGLTGLSGKDGSIGIQGETGPKGENGGSIIFAYNNFTGVGNTSPISTDTMFTIPIDPSYMATDGNEIEIDLCLEYSDNDPVNLTLELAVGQTYTHTVVNSIPETRFVNFKIARIAVSEQLWTVKALSDISSSALVQSLDIQKTTFTWNVPINLLFKVANTTLGADQVVVKSFVVYSNKIV